MSLKKSKLDLLVRVRYSNPLPAPPCPPKLLDIPTHPSRYARPEFTDAIAQDAPLPMIVDAELGMPLDLSRWECLWNDAVDDSLLNPDPNNLPKLDPRDEFLLQDPASTSSTPYANGLVSSVPSTPSAASQHISWLRKTDFTSRDSRMNVSQEPRQIVDAPIDISRAAQISDIETSFAASENIDLKTLKHPNKPNVTAVESFEILPDADIWPNAYDLFRFSERPGDRPTDVDDVRLDCAIMRPMESDGEHFLAYYLAKDDEVAEQFKRKRWHASPETQDPTPLQFVRDYEVQKVEQEVSNEFLLVLDDGGGEEDVYGDEVKPARRPKGAYYKNIERKMTLKKKRGNMNEAYVDKWDICNVHHVAMDADEEEERKESLAEVMNPMYLMDRDAEGEVVDESLIPASTSATTNGHAAAAKVEPGAVDVIAGA